MPITLIRNTKDNAMHGTDNERYTGCRMKLQGGSWYSREGELKDITDLTCDRCKEVFATKMIRESNKEELRIAKEEKKKYQRAKKQGMVREATYEEYLMNREAEASARRDSKDDAAISQSLHSLKDAIPAEQPYGSYNQPVSAPQNQFNPYNNPSPAAVPQSPFDPYAQQTPVVSAPQSAFDPYAQQTPVVSAPQAPFDPYAQATPVVTAPQAPFDPYAYVQPQQNMFNPYAQTPAAAPSFAPQGGSMQLDSIETPAQQEIPEDNTPTPSFQEYTGAASISTPSVSSSSASAENDDFLSQFMFKPAASPAEEPAPAAPVSAEEDILSQFNIGAKPSENIQEHAPQAVTPVSAPHSAPKADASSFFSDSIPVIGAEYAGASSVNSVVTEFGSLNIAETPKDEFVVPDVPVYQPGGNSYISSGSGQQVSQNSVFIEELATPASPVSQTSSFDSDNGLGSLMASFDNSDDLMSGFGDFSAPSVSNTAESNIPSMGGFDTVTPVQPAPSMAGFDTVTPVQPAPSMGGFDTVTPVQPAPSMGGFDTVTPVQPAPSMSGFDTVTPVQPAPSMGGFGTVTPVQPVSAMGGFGTAAPVQPSYGQNSFAQQPVVNPYQNSYAAPVQPQGFQMPQGFGTPAQPQRPAAPAPAPAPAPVAQKPIFGESGNGTADSIEDALRQLGADIGTTNTNNNQMPEKEEIVPDFVAYVPSSSKVLHTSAPSPSSASSAPKRPISAREAKQLAKIDAKFKKDLISRGFNPNEIKNGRRGK